MYASLMRGMLGSKTCKEVEQVKLGRGPSLIDAVATEASKDQTMGGLSRKRKIK